MSISIQAGTITSVNHTDYIQRASQLALVVKNLPANAGDVRNSGSIPGPGRSPGEGNGNPLQYSCLENPMDRGAWQATVHGVTMSQTYIISHYREIKSHMPLWPKAKT